MSRFQDHFSVGSAGYARFRPTYPDALFDWLARVAPRRRLAWDCATGTGQAAVGLAPRFDLVIATDASAEQLAHAAPVANVSYRVATAEESGLDDRSVDLITIAQALHWVDRPRFFKEAARVAAPGALLAIWMYNLAKIDSSIDAVISRFYTETVGPFWPADRVHIDQEYRTFELPFPAVESPRFAMEADWTADQLLGYLGTWSAVSRFAKERGHDPVAILAPELTRLWGDPARPRRIRWPLTVRVVRIAEAGGNAP